MAEQYKNDFQTPPDVAKYMVSLIPPGTKTVLEPTPGKGNILREITNAGFQATAPTDFFLLDKNQRFDCIVMNPPFSHKFTIMNNAPLHYFKNGGGMRVGYSILMDCLLKSDVVIALMPWFTLSDSDVRIRQLKKYGMKSITSLPRKTFEFSRIQTIVMEMHKGYTGPTEFKVYDLLKNPLYINKKELF